MGAMPTTQRMTADEYLALPYDIGPKKAAYERAGPHEDAPELALAELFPE